jgi:predicted RNA binding protein YcfA (HicA-like mRNA interferase family)
MSGGIPRGVSGKQVVAAFKKAGFVAVRTKGAHRILRTEIAWVSVPEEGLEPSLSLIYRPMQGPSSATTCLVGKSPKSSRQAGHQVLNLSRPSRRVAARLLW